MVKFVVVEKFGESKTLDVSNLKLEDLYKKCKFRKKDYFSKRHTWKVKRNDVFIYIHLYAKDAGRPKTINKFDLPPPVDNDLFYGNMGLVASTDEECSDLCNFTSKEWEKVYVVLMGGFEDLDSEEGERSSDEYIPPELKSKQGYSKEDDFIVEDGDAIEFFSSSDEPSEDEYEFDDEDGSTQTEDELPVEEGESSNKSNDEEEKTDVDDGDDNTDEDNENDGDDELEKGDSELTEEEYVKEN